MTVLILGGAGYIGSHATDEFLARGYDVAVVDNLSTGHRAAVADKARFYQGDIRDKAFLTDVFTQEKNIEGVMHFCAYSLVGESMTKPLMYFENNVGGAMTLLEVIQAFEVQHIVFSSTAATFGIPEEMPITEKTPQKPINPYGESKLIMEKMMAWQAAATDMTYVALRYFNVAGAKHDGSIGEAHKNETHLIPIILQVALGQREKIMIYGDDYQTQDGTCVRDYIGMTDLIDAHIKSLEYLKAGGQSDAFNLGTKTGYSNLQVLETARQVTGHAIPSEIGPRRIGDPDALVADSSKAQEILAWTPKEKLADIIQNAWTWHQNHPHGYED
jgi:UDP-glucose 4-epimerase